MKKPKTRIAVTATTIINVSSFISLKSVNKDNAHKTIQSGISGVRISIPQNILKEATIIPIRSQITIIKKILNFFLKSLDNPEKPNLILFFFDFIIIKIRKYL